MGDPDQRLTSLNTYVGAWNTQNIDTSMIWAPWWLKKPIYTEKMFSIILQAMDSAGALHPLVDTSGHLAGVDDLIGDADALGRSSVEQPTVTDLSQASLAARSKAYRTLGALGVMVLAGGNLANHVLSVAVSGYYDVITLVGLWSDTADTYTLAFDDEDGTDLSGIPPAIDVTVAAGEVTWLHEMMGWAAADNKDIRVSISGGAGVEKLHLIYKLHKET